MSKVISPLIKEEIKSFKSALSSLPTSWDAKECILELKEANYTWKQFPWSYFYFEYKLKQALQDLYQFPGDNHYDRLAFNLKSSINWDCIVKSIKYDDPLVTLNYKPAIERSVKEYGYHGVILAMCDIEYHRDKDGFFEWHANLYGGKVEYTDNPFNQYISTTAELKEICYIVIAKDQVDVLGYYREQIRGNENYRPTWYVLDVENFGEFFSTKQIFSPIGNNP